MTSGTYVSIFNTEDGWELDALSPTVISDLVEKALTAIIDKPTWEASEAHEATTRAAMIEALADMPEIPEAPLPQMPAPVEYKMRPLDKALPGDWKLSPKNPAYGFKGDEVVLVSELRARYEFPPEGWRVHPNNPAYYYKGQEVLTIAQLRARM